VARLKAVFDQYYTYQPDKGMWNSLFDITPEQCAEVSARIMEVVKPRLDLLMNAYNMPSATFMTKNPNELGVCDLHRDFSVVDEQEQEYRNIWIPLVDTDENNGALYVLRRSHIVFDHPLPMFVKWPYVHMQHELFQHVEMIEAKAGDLVVYTDRTLHGSFLNKGKTARPVVHFGVFHPTCEYMYHHLEDDGMVKAYPVPSTFFFENSFGNQDHRFPIRKQFRFAPPPIKVDDVVADLLAHR
jgi:ectoine hydroxylase-related dioxygenase (phytanoyl-CoA dioxygenase family)